MSDEAPMLKWTRLGPLGTRSEYRSERVGSYHAVIDWCRHTKKWRTLFFRDDIARRAHRHATVGDAKREAERYLADAPPPRAKARG